MSAQEQNNSTQPDDLFALVLAKTPYNWYTDKLMLYLIVPMGSFGALFNLVSFAIFCKKSFDEMPLFKYMRVYTLASMVVSCSLILSFMLAPFTLPKFLLEYISRVFICKIIQSFVTNFFFFYENVLDIFISIERGLIFSTEFKRFKKISPYLICLILLAVCILINGPIFISFDIVPDSELSVLGQWELSRFSASSFGKPLLAISYITQEPVVFIFVIITNIIALISYRRFLERKFEAKNHPAQANRRDETAEQKKKRKKDEKANAKLLFMTFYLSVFSAVNHMIEFSAQFCLIILELNPSNLAWFTFIYMFNFALKNFMNLYFFINFNSQFRHAFIFWRKTPASGNIGTNNKANWKT